MKKLIIVILSVAMLCNIITPAYAYYGRGGWGRGGYGRGWGYGGYGRGWGWGWGGFAAGTIIGAAAYSACYPRYQTVYVSGVPYYTCNGAYYQTDCYGNYYAVAAPVVQPVVYQQPVVVQQPAPAVVQQPAPAATAPVVQAQPQSQDALTINIPNSQGGYTAITFKKAGDGYVGPQGEYYSGNPTVEQLKVLYGK